MSCIQDSFYCVMAEVVGFEPTQPYYVLTMV